MNDADRIRFLRRSPHPALLASAIATLLVASGLAASPTAIDPPAAAGSFGLELVEDDGAVIATWIEPREGAAAIRFSRFDPAGKGSWSAPRTVAERKDLFANWADRPAVRRVADGSLLAHELRKIAEGTYAYGVRLSRSTDEGATWTDLGWLHDDTRSVEHGFVSMLTEGDDTLAVWLDGREMPEQAAGDGHGHGHGHEGGAMTLRTAILPGKGPAPKAESPKGPATSRGLDGRVCECCATDVAMTDRGPVVVYRDRGPNEERDISIVRRDRSRTRVFRRLDHAGMPRQRAVDRRGRLEGVCRLVHRGGRRSRRPECTENAGGPQPGWRRDLRARGRTLGHHHRPHRCGDAPLGRRRRVLGRSSRSTDRG